MKKPSTWLIIIGCIIILIPIMGSWYTSYQQEKLYEEYMNNQELSDSIDEMDSAYKNSTEDDDAIDATGSAVNSSEPTAVVVKYKPVVIGRVEIPSASIDLLLVEGTTAKDLNWGAGHLSGTPMPGETGNCAIAGHRNYTFGSYFSRLDEVKAGDQITVEYNQTSFSYEAYEIVTVLPSDTSVLAQTDEDSILTLITCAPKGSNIHTG